MGNSGDGGPATGGAYSIEPHTAEKLFLAMLAMAIVISLQTVGNNIANANTQGYSRQEVQLETAKGQYTGAGFFGNGVPVEFFGERTTLPPGAVATANAKSTLPWKSVVVHPWRSKAAETTTAAPANRPGR